MATPLDAQQVLDREFLEIRGKILEIASSLDRLQRAAGTVEWGGQCLHANSRSRGGAALLKLANSGGEPRRADEGARARMICRANRSSPPIGVPSHTV